MFLPFSVWKSRVPSEDGSQSLIALQSWHEHTRRRKPWSRAFNTNSIKGYEPIVQKRASQLVGCLEKRAVTKQEFASATITSESGSIDLAKWLSYFTTDFMGDMAFGGGFELMRDDGDKEGIWTMIESGLRWDTFILSH